MEVEEPVKPKKESTKRIKIGIVVFLAAILVILVAIPIVILNYKTSPEKPAPPKPEPVKKPFDLSKLSEDEKSRVNCFLEEESKFEKLTKYQCELRECIYKESEYERVPTCFFDRTKLGYSLDEDSLLQNKSSYKLKLNAADKVPYLGAIEKLNFNVQYLGENIINIKIDSNEPRYEVPYPLHKPAALNPVINTKARVELVEDPATKLISFKIIRNSDDEVIFDTGFGGFIYCDQFIQISSHLSASIFGFGENNHESLKHDLNYRSWGMFARDNAPGWGENKNLYGTQPVYLGMEKSGKSHAVLLYNSNSMEYLFTPSPSLTLRTIGGVLDFYFVVEETPDLVLQSYHQLIGTTVLPPYWSFGFQICRWGYQNLSQVQEVIERTAAIDLPHDVQYIDIEYMIGYRILTVDQVNYKGLGTYMKKIRDEGLKLVLIVDPGLVLERNNSFYMTGVENDIYVKWPINLAPYDRDNINPEPNDAISWCWPNAKISYPDYMDDNTHKWWEQSLRDFMDNETYGCDMDGVWIDMNEPSSFETNEEKPWNWLYPLNETEKYPFFTLKCPTNRFDDPPYRTKSAFSYDNDDLLAKKSRLSQKTLCMIHKHKMDNKEYYHYDVHNLYAHAQSVATYKALQNIKTNLRPFTLTRSNYVGTGSYAVHWLGDNDSSWKHMKMSIIGILEYNIFGIPMVGADICGFFINIRDAEMCTRWLQVGSFYSFTRNHNAKNELDKDPAAFNNKTLEDSTRDVLRIRYALLPYIYTQFYHSHTKGGSVNKPLFFEFPTDPKTLSIDEQFMLGPGLLVSPVLNPGQTVVKAYFPDARWYDYRTGVEINATNKWMNVSAPIKIIPLHLKGGIITPIQEPRGLRNTTHTRKQPLGLIVSLDKNQEAKGDLFWDDGVSFSFKQGEYFHSEFEFKNNGISFKTDKKPNDTTIDDLTFSDIKINGYNVKVKSFSITIKSNVTTKTSFNQTENQVHLFDLDAKINQIEEIKIIN